MLIINNCDAQFDLNCTVSIVGAITTLFCLFPVIIIHFNTQSMKLKHHCCTNDTASKMASYTYSSEELIKQDKLEKKTILFKRMSRQTEGGKKLAYSGLKEVLTEMPQICQRVASGVFCEQHLRHVLLQALKGPVSCWMCGPDTGTCSKASTA